MSGRKLPIAHTPSVQRPSLVRSGGLVAVLVLVGSVTVFLALARAVRRDGPAGQTPIEELVRSLDDIDRFVDTVANDVLVSESERDERTELGFGLYVYQPVLAAGEREPANCLHREHWVLWERAGTKPSDAVILVHGLDEPGSIWNTSVRTLASRGYTVLRFEYPNDGPIKGAADRFERELQQAHRDGLTRVTYVGHSMGGLVSMEMLTRDRSASRASEIPETQRLITVGTPFGGSAWAKLRAVAEIRDQVERLVTDNSIGSAALLRHMQDGLGEAGDDLMPGSAFLVELNKRMFPPSFPVTCVVGKLRQSRRIDPSWLRDSVVLNELLGRKQNALMVQSLETLVDDLGDGVVPVESASPSWANDVVRVEASHRGMLEPLPVEHLIDGILGAAPDTSEIPPAIPIILDRLARDAQAAGG
ncbi:MAG: alpha/beta fold hydrolase [Phycisphaeraceae bacterium]|nr:alpha/beta fold hydrolase [Phycisphaerales bacterium]MCB9860248.1 alpha/beta fold hydrolase [Phycisphaeraceae bacterium]